MEKGSLSIDQIILIVIGMIVLVLAIVLVTNMLKNVEPINDNAKLYSECSTWRLHGYSTETFKLGDYPALFQTYGSNCLDKGKLKPDCEGDNNPKIEPLARSAKNFCTMKRTCTESDCGTCPTDHPCQPNDDNQCECQK